MPDTQFDKITLNADRSITATGPYNPLLSNDANTNWLLVGQPVVVFMVIKNDAAGNPDLVANGVGVWPVPSLGQPLGNWTGTIPASNVPGDIQVGSGVRAIGAAIQVKIDRYATKNPPVVELATWCVPQTISGP